MELQRKKRTALLAALGGAAVLLALLLVASWALFGSLGVGARYLRGERLIVAPTRIDTGARPQGAQERTRVTVHNYTGGEVTLLGGQASCSRCLAVSDLPRTIPARGSFELELEVRFAGQPGPFVQEYVVFTDSPARPHVRVTISGAVLEQAVER